MWETFKSASSATSTPPLSSTSGQRSGVSLTTNQRKRIRHLMKTARKDPRHSQVSLGGYLLMPVQRIPRYKMLLERLMDCTPSLDCPDQADSIIAEAFACMSDLAMEMNERKRDNEGRRKLVSSLVKSGVEHPSDFATLASLARTAVPLQITSRSTSPYCTSGGSDGELHRGSNSKVVTVLMLA